MGAVIGVDPMELGVRPMGREARHQMSFVEEGRRSGGERCVDDAERLEASGRGRVTSAAPYFRTVVGTDRYADELW